jgi:hypothetical protein
MNMSILSTNNAYEPTAPAINWKLQDVLNRLKPLEASQAELALDAELGGAGAAERLTKLQADIAAEKATIGKLKLAHTAGLGRDQVAERAQRAALRKAQVAALRKHLEARDSAADALTVAIAEAVKQFKVLVERSRKGGDASPIGSEWPEGAITGIGQIQALVAQELYRIDGGDPMIGNRRSFPGAAVLHLDYQGKPHAIVPLADHLRANSKFILDTVTSDVS